MTAAIEHGTWLHEVLAGAMVALKALPDYTPVLRPDGLAILVSCRDGGVTNVCVEQGKRSPEDAVRVLVQRTLEHLVRRAGRKLVRDGLPFTLCEDAKGKPLGIMHGGRSVATPHRGRVVLQLPVPSDAAGGVARLAQESVPCVLPVVSEARLRRILVAAWAPGLRG